MNSATTDTQIRAARELLRWDQKRLAQEASLSLATIRRYEGGQQVSDDTAGDLVAALEKAGILFMGSSSINGVTVSSAIALRAWAKPEDPPATRIYVKKPSGRPKGSKNKPKAP